MIALIDADVLVYRVGYASEDCEEPWMVKARLEESIDQILYSLGNPNYRLFLSDSKSNFRNALFPLYKANRTQPKPKYYEHITNWLLNIWHAEVAWNEEADDALGIEQVREGQNSIIVSIDKDLLQIPGNHYNFVNHNRSFVEPFEGVFNFYKQVLTGDSSDNVCIKTGLSCPTIGAAKAQKCLEGCPDEAALFNTVRNLYRKFCGIPDVEADQRLLLTGQLLKIRQKEGEIWEFPV